MRIAATPCAAIVWKTNFNDAHDRSCIARKLRRLYQGLLNLVA